MMAMLSLSPMVVFHSNLHPMPSFQEQPLLTHVLLDSKMAHAPLANVALAVVVVVVVVMVAVGHASVLQDWLCAMSKAQATPPSEAAITERERDVIPLAPHETVHGDHADQPRSTQSTGHAATPQSWLSSRGLHSTPWCCAATLTERKRDCEPPPHEAVHVDHADQSFTTQSTAHAAWPGHGSVTSLIIESQLLPPFSA
jgi:hypothetical protein